MRWQAKVAMQVQPDVDARKCVSCGACIRLCHHSVFRLSAGSKPEIANPAFCESGCRICARICPSGAITFADEEEFIAYLHTRLHQVNSALAKIPELPDTIKSAQRPHQKQPS